MNRGSKFGAIAILLVVFSIGSLAGVGGTIYYLKQSHDRHRGGGDRGLPLRDVYRVQTERMTERLEGSLNLTEEQVPLVRAEIEKFSNAMRSIHESTRPKYEALMQERTNAIEKHLTPEQLEQFREQRKSHRERSRKDWRDGSGERKAFRGDPSASCGGVRRLKNC